MTETADLAYLDNRSYARKKQLAMAQPEAITTRSTVVVEDETGIETTYIVVTVRVLTSTGSAHLSFIEWQDGQTDEAFKIVLPSKVVSKVANHIDATNARNRSRVSRRNSNPNAFGNYRAALDVNNPRHPFVVSDDEEVDE